MIVQIGGIGYSAEENTYFVFNKAEDFSEGLAVVNQNMKYGFIDTNGNEVIPISLQYASSFSEGLAAVCINGKFGFMDKKGKLVINNEYDYAKSFKYMTAHASHTLSHEVDINSHNQFEKTETQKS